MSKNFCAPKEGRDQNSISVLRSEEITIVSTLPPPQVERRPLWPLRKGTIIRTHLWEGSCNRYFSCEPRKEVSEVAHFVARRWRGLQLKCFSGPTLGRGLPSRVSLGRASSPEGGGGPMGYGMWVLLMESELSFSSEGWSRYFAAT